MTIKLLEIVKATIPDFLAENDIQLKSNLVTPEDVEMVSKDFVIYIIHNAWGQDSILFKLTKASNTIDSHLDFPYYLELTKVCQGLNIPSEIDYTKNWREFIEARMKKLVDVWQVLMQLSNPIEFLLELASQEKQQKIERSTKVQFEGDLILGKEAFKKKDYEKVIEILSPHAGQLSSYYSKLLNISLKRH